MRFVAPGLYRIEALSSAGEVALDSLAVTLAQSGPAVIQLAPGARLAGRVIHSHDRQPVRGARVVMLDPQLTGGVAVTDAAGAFEFAPLARTPVTLTVEKAGFQQVTVGPHLPKEESLTVALPPLPSLQLTGLVRSRAKGRPIAGAVVRLISRGQQLQRTLTGADGRFRMAAVPEQARMSIAAEGFQLYEEMIDPAAAPPTYDLLPSDAASRVAAGMTALLRGRVVGPDGAPRPGTPVRVFPDNDRGFEGIAGRRIVQGGLLVLPHLAQSGIDGTFELEVMVGGPARIVPIDGVSRPDDGVRVDIALGRTRDGLMLRTRR